MVRRVAICISFRQPQAGPRVAAWASSFFGEHRPAHKFGTVVGLLGLHRTLSQQEAVATAIFFSTLYETWIWAKHGRAPPITTPLFRSRLRHLAVRSPQVAAAERELTEAGYLVG